MSKSDLFEVKAPVNNGSLDPFQGYDADVYVLDQVSGNYILVGRFVSIQIEIKCIPEPYLGINKRVARMLDGELMFSWQMERGQLDSRILEQTFGLKSISPDELINRLPRFQISFIVSAEGLSIPNTNESEVFSNRMATGEMVLSFCKVHNLTIAATAGKAVIGNRWEGSAEGLTFINRKEADYSKTNTTLGSNYGTVDRSFGDWYVDSLVTPFRWD